MHFGATPRLHIVFYMQSVPFTRAVLNHETSLGGSESACRVLMEALAARGHDVHCFATQLEAPGEYFGVQWHADTDLPEVLKFAPPDVFVSLRMPHVFQLNIPAKMRVFWTQDLLIEPSVVGQLYAVDRTVFVSQYHREQWCHRQPLLRPTAWVTRNPIDSADVAQANPFAARKTKRRLIHISRPERGLDGVMALWPKIRAQFPDATIAICRYSSMYDATGWGKVCESYDQRLQALNAQVGGIEFLGELNKTQLYAEIAKSVALLYPTTQANFAETNCVAATEAQACGTPIIATRRGALPETVAAGAGILIDGEVFTDEAVQAKFLQAVADVFAAQEDPEETFDRYERMRQRGAVHALAAYGHEVAEDWERMILEFFEARYNRSKIEVLRQLLQWDQHAAGKIVAKDIIVSRPDDGPGVDAELDEAFEALGLCDRVIRQEEQTAEHYAKYAVQDPRDEARDNARLHQAADRIAAHIALLREDGHLRDVDGKERPARILDVSCGNGSMALCVLERLAADTVYHGVDYSEGVIALARQVTSEFGRRVRFWTITDSNDLGPFVAERIRSGDLNLGEHYDAVFSGEFVEHVEQPWALLDTLERVAEPEGLVLLTTPSGPFGELLQRGIPRQRGHVHAFSVRDLTTMCADKRGFGWSFLSIGPSPRGTACGYWIFGFRPGGGPAHPIDYTTTILTERPYQRVNASMIVANGITWLQKCLDSLYGVVDKVVIYDTGSTDGSIELARSLGAEVIEGAWPNNFAEARNRSLAVAERDAEWIFWIDADEHVQNPSRLRMYAIDGGLFNGYVVRQKHLCIDQPGFEDKPVRLFRTGRGVQFYGVVHEQPEEAIDKGITPALDQQDVALVHFGYEDEGVRRWKMKNRNLPLLMTEITGKGPHPPRKLAWVLYMRDCVSLAGWEIERAGGRRTRGAQVLAQRAVGVYTTQGFDDPAHHLHEIAWPYYQQALTLLGAGVECAWTFAAAAGRLDRSRVQPKIQTFKTRTTEELRRLVSHQVDRWTAQLDGDPIDIEPYYEVDVPSQTVSAETVRTIVRSAAGASWGDDRRVLEWASLFLDAVRNTGVDVPILEIGTFKGASALVWLKLLKALGRTTPVITVDPYGGKPYEGGNGSGEALYTGETFVAMKRLLAEFPNHFHFPIGSMGFLCRYPADVVWHEGRAIPLDTFAFALLDGQHDARTIERELQYLLQGAHLTHRSRMAPGGVIVVDNIDADTETLAMLNARYPDRELREAKWGQLYAVIRVPNVPALAQAPAEEAVA
jgi:glycosyltransferase involved in cell wall biosynthesis/2-polyprenyl-3-methyl-5-hydroxy-6-metoxy-1,4-benzoquinol methylase